MAKFEDAICFFDEALEIEPNNVAALSNKGISLDNLGQHDLAVSYYVKALKLNLVYVKALAVNAKYSDILLLYFEGLKDITKTIKKISRINMPLNNTIDNCKLLKNAGYMLAELGKQKSAIMCYDKAISLGAKDSEIYVYKSISLIKQERFSMALESITHALQLDPNSEFAKITEKMLKQKLDSSKKHTRKTSGKMKSLTLNLVFTIKK